MELRREELRPWFHGAAAFARGAAFDPSRPNNLDLLRFVAASLVLVDHSFVLTGRPGGASVFQYESLGGFGVALFFVVSGFLVASSWERSPRLSEFARKRALRILPAFVVVVALCALVLGPLATTLPLASYLRHEFTRGYFWNLSFVELHYALPGVFAANPYPHAVNGSIWTLPIEVAMYVALAALGALRLLTRTSATIVVAALALVWFGAEAQLRGTPAFFLDVLPAAHTVHLALWFFTGTAYWLWRARIHYRADVAIAFALGCWIAQGTFAGILLLHATLPYMAIAFATLDVRWMSGFGRRGDFSYGMYLYAFPVQQTLAAAGGAAWPLPAYMAACFAATLAFAIASWHWVERPMLRRKTSMRGHPPSARRSG